MKLAPFISVLAATVFWTGCTSVESRATRYPQTWGKTSPKDQLRLRQGIVNNGDTPEQVYIAWGRPDTEHHFTGPNGKERVAWTWAGVGATGASTAVELPSPVRNDPPDFAPRQPETMIPGDPVSEAAARSRADSEESAKAFAAQVRHHANPELTAPPRPRRSEGSSARRVIFEDGKVIPGKVLYPQQSTQTPVHLPQPTGLTE